MQSQEKKNWVSICCEKKKNEKHDLNTCKERETLCERILSIKHFQFPADVMTVMILVSLVKWA